MKSGNNIDIFTKTFWLLLFSLSLAACATKQCDDCWDNDTQSAQQLDSDYICYHGQAYAGQVIGDGHCVSLIKHCSNAPDTQWWRPGPVVWGNSIKTGSIIATFKNNRYPNVSGYHAAIYIRQDSRGIWVWDQWQGKSVHQRLIRWRTDNAPAANTAQSYRLVKGVK